MKIVINKCFGGFNLSEAAKTRIRELLGQEWPEDDELDRSLPEMVRAVEELGDKANGQFSNLVVCEIPDDVKYEIFEYDGIESIHEVHRMWE